jgi:hypothetical protein
MRKVGFSSVPKCGSDMAGGILPGELVLLPVADDAVKSLEKWGRPLQHLSLEEIKRIIDKRAMQEVGA